MKKVQIILDNKILIFKKYWEMLVKYCKSLNEEAEININDNEKQIMRLMVSSNYKDLSTDQIIYLKQKINTNTDKIISERLKKANEEIKIIEKYNQTKLKTI